MSANEKKSTRLTSGSGSRGADSGFSGAPTVPGTPPLYVRTHASYNPLTQFSKQKGLYIPVCCHGEYSLVVAFFSLRGTACGRFRFLRKGIAKTCGGVIMCFAHMFFIKPLLGKRGRRRSGRRRLSCCFGTRLLCF